LQACGVQSMVCSVDFGAVENWRNGICRIVFVGSAVVLLGTMKALQLVFFAVFCVTAAVYCLRSFGFFVFLCCTASLLI